MSDTEPLPKSWMKYLGEEFSKAYMKDLKRFLAKELDTGKVIFPKMSEIFSAYYFTPLDQVKVVIIGQDPYHGPNQAHGLCFSVKYGVRTPPSLQNIYKEIHRDLGFSIPSHGYLEEWARQGVLMINNVLTVESGKAASHKGRGWEYFTDKTVEILNEQKEHLVFLLWGSHAQKKAKDVDRKKHLVLEAPHPSPLSAHRGFLGCGHFSQTNLYLSDYGIDPIDWSIHT